MTGARKRGFDIPWSKDRNVSFIEAEWPNLEAFINQPAAAVPGGSLTDLWINMRQGLNRLAGYPERWYGGDPGEHGTPRPPFTMIIEAGFVVCQRDSVRWIPSLGNETLVMRQDLTFGHGGEAWLDVAAVKKLQQYWTLVVVLLWDPAVRDRVRVCPVCFKYFMLKSARQWRKGEPRKPCSGACRTSFKKRPERMQAAKASARSRVKAYRDRQAQHVASMRTLVATRARK